MERGRAGDRLEDYVIGFVSTFSFASKSGLFPVSLVKDKVMELLVSVFSFDSFLPSSFRCARSSLGSRASH